MKPDDAKQSAFEGAEDVASATECTGLMPALPRDDASEAECAALYAIHRAKGARERRYRRK